MLAIETERHIWPYGSCEFEGTAPDINDVITRKAKRPVLKNDFDLRSKTITDSFK